MNKKFLAGICALTFGMTAFAAYQYNIKGNQGWLSFDSDTTLGFGLSTTGKDKDHENYIDRGKGVADYGWYNLETGTTGSFGNGTTANFTENDRIGLYVKDNEGNVYITTKPSGNVADNVLWGKSRVVHGGISLAGGNFGSNGTHEYYVFKVSNNNTIGKPKPSGQPLPGILAVLAVGGAAFGLKKLRDKKKAADK